jgi:hypothetical protein
LKSITLQGAYQSCRQHQIEAPSKHQPPFKIIEHPLIIGVWEKHYHPQSHLANKISMREQNLLSLSKGFEIAGDSLLVLMSVEIELSL